jgi:hypothetical protein
MEEKPPDKINENINVVYDPSNDLGCLIILFVIIVISVLIYKSGQC